MRDDPTQPPPDKAGHAAPPTRRVQPAPSRDAAAATNASADSRDAGAGAGGERADGDAPPPSTFRRLLRSIITAACWLALVGAAAPVIFAWSWRIEPDHEGVLLRGLAFFAFAVRAASLHIAGAVAVAAAFAALLKRFKPALGLALIAAFLALPSVDDALRFRSPPAAPPGSTELTVLSFNAFVGRADLDQTIDLIDRERPDVVLFQEFAQPFAGGVERAVARRFPHRFHLSTGGAYGTAVFSTLPFADSPGAVPTPHGLPPSDWKQLAVELHLGDDRSLHLVNVHAPNPMAPRRVVEQHAVKAALVRHGERHADHPVLLMGDFNATAASQLAADLRDAGWRDAHRAAGAGLAFTHAAAPRLKGLMPGVRIDHAYTNDALTVTDFRTLDWIDDSDHRPILVRIAVP